MLGESLRRVCADKFTWCHTEAGDADQTLYITQSQYTDTGSTSPSTDPITSGSSALETYLKRSCVGRGSRDESNPSLYVAFLKTYHAAHPEKANSFFVPIYISGFLPVLVRFLRMLQFSNPTIEAVTFRLRRRCMFRVFLLPTFTRQDLLSLCVGMHVCTH